MVQNLEKYYGLRIRACRDIEADKYNELKANLADAFSKCGSEDRRDYAVYVTRFEFLVVRDEVFGVGPLSERLRETDLRVSVNKKEKEHRKIMFLNAEVPENHWLISPSVTVRPNKYTISTKLTGDYCAGSTAFEMLVLTCVLKGLSPDRRKLKISATAHPTATFSSRFRNIDGRVTTGLDYSLDHEVQLMLKFS